MMLFSVEYFQNADDSINRTILREELNFTLVSLLLLEFNKQNTRGTKIEGTVKIPSTAVLMY